MRPHPPQSFSEPKAEVVGTKTHDQIENEWLAEFRTGPQSLGRPTGPGWLTKAEMAAKAGVSVKRISRWLESQAPGTWETVLGYMATVVGPRRATFHRKVQVCHGAVTTSKRRA